MNCPFTYSQANRQRFVAELMEFLRFPSVSAQPKQSKAIKKCAAWLANHLRKIGLQDVQVISTPRHPLVYAEWVHLTDRPTVLIYGHYDVQPADPLALWSSPPFEPTLHGNDLLGRGASDDKGQLFVHVKALEAYLRTVGNLPVNVKCIFDGEEEIGSPHLAPFLTRNKEALTADIALMSDTRLLGPDSPAITYGLRGTLSLELEVNGPHRDLHSGNFGGAVHNPLQVLCELIAGLHNKTGAVAIPGFYDQVQKISAYERAYLARTGPTNKKVLQDAQANVGWGERGYTNYERTTIRPCISVNGVIGGYQGHGPKAVIPAKAVAKLNFRLVPNQTPEAIEQLFREHITRITPPTIRTTIRTAASAKPAVVCPDHPAMSAAALAYEQGFGRAPVFLRSGGTIPAVNLFQETLGIPTVLMGFALPDDRLHAPNEKFHLPNFYRGITTSIRFLAEMGREKRGTGNDY